MERIGFIGIGTMGRPMSANLVKAGYPMTVYDVVADATRPVVELGARAAGSIAELTEASDIIFTMVPNSPERWTRAALIEVAERSTSTGAST